MALPRSAASHLNIHQKRSDHSSVLADRLLTAVIVVIITTDSKGAADSPSVMDTDTR